LVSGCDATVHGGNLVMVGALSFHVVVVGANEPPPCDVPSGGGVPEASFPARRREELLGGVLDRGRCGVDASLRVEPMKMVHSLALLRERLKRRTSWR
jgi:hypothetical protein